VKGKIPLLAWILFGSVRIDLVWLATVAFFVGISWYRRRKRQELSRLLDLKEQMADPEEKDTSMKQFADRTEGKLRLSGRLRRRKKKGEV
jgi:hypothetical protein